MMNYESKVISCKHRSDELWLINSVQDQLLDKRNGNLKPDYRSDYLYGNSIPLASADIKDFMKRKLEDLGRRAGGGPICKAHQCNYLANAFRHCLTLDRRATCRPGKIWLGDERLV